MFSNMSNFPMCPTSGQEAGVGAAADGGPSAALSTVRAAAPAEDHATASQFTLNFLLKLSLYNMFKMTCSTDIFKKTKVSISLLAYKFKNIIKTKQYI